MQSCDWIMIPSSIQTKITHMQCFVWNQRNWARNNGSRLRTIGEATMRAACQLKCTAFLWKICLLIASTRIKYTLWQQRILLKLNGLTRPWNTSFNKMQSLIKDWRSNSLKTLLVSAKMVGWLSPSHSKCMQSNGITTTYSTLDTHVLKRQWMLQSTGKVCVPTFGH